MFEVTGRDGMARAGVWTYRERKFSTPLILFHASERIPTPDEAEALVGAHPGKGDGRPFVELPPFGLLGGSAPEGDASLRPEVGEASLARTSIESVAFVEPDLEALRDFAPAELNVVDNCVVLLRDHRRFAEFFAALRERVGHQRLVYAPGIAEPVNLALLLYCGIDLVDSSRLALESRLGNFLTNSGRLKKGSERLCYCRGCQAPSGYESLLHHNYCETLAELELARRSISEGILREQVEKRAACDGWSTCVLRHLDLRLYAFQERHFRVSAPGGTVLSALSGISLNRPDIVRFRTRLRERYSKPPGAKVLLLLPCSARKPYSLSKTHKLMNQALARVRGREVIHRVVVTSPLGLVPMELELFYPAQHYDIPVTGDWSADEREMLRTAMRDFLARNRYDSVVVHLGGEETVVRPILEDIGQEARFTALEGDATSDASLGSLADALGEATAGLEGPGKAGRLHGSMTALAGFQFGAVGAKLLEGAEVSGIYPNLKISKEGNQLGALSAERGMLSLTLEGARILARDEGYRVDIEDFVPQSTVFAVGVVGAGDAIRIGDEVAVVHGGEVRGAGVAVMTPREMVESERGVAVKVRHHA